MRWIEKIFMMQRFYFHLRAVRAVTGAALFAILPHQVKCGITAHSGLLFDRGRDVVPPSNNNPNALHGVVVCTLGLLFDRENKVLWAPSWPS